MSDSNFGKLGDDLMKVPRLEASGANWVVYRDRFLWSVDARGLLEHVDGSKKEPVCPVKPRMVPRKDSEGRETRDLVHAPYTQEEERSVKEWKAELKAWKRGEAVVKQQIAATIPDSIRGGCFWTPSSREAERWMHSGVWIDVGVSCSPIAGQPCSTRGMERGKGLILKLC
jgi:hypothetical protein